MFEAKEIFSGFSVDDIAKAKDFYTNIVGLEIEDETMGLRLSLGGAGHVFIYEKKDHQPATFTILNFVVDSIDEAVEILRKKGVQFEQYDMGQAEQDEKGILRGKEYDMGPNIAWFKDPAGNILAVLEP